MRNGTKIGLAAAALLILAGGILFACGMSELPWDFTKLSSDKYETNRYEISESFSNISIETDTADLLFALSDDGKCRVECYEEEKVKHSVAVAEDTLSVKVTDTRAWYDYIGITYSAPKITVYLPETQYTSLFIDEDTGDIEMPKDFSFMHVDISLSTGAVKFSASASQQIKIRTSTGDLRVENVSAGALDLTVSTGMITVSDVVCQGDASLKVSTGETNLTNMVCKNLASEGSTGDAILKKVVAERMSITRSTGDVRLDSVDAAEIFVETDTGDVVGSLLSDKVFITKTDTGRVDVPKTVTGGKCEIKTNTGDIRITIDPE